MSTEATRPLSNDAALPGRDDHGGRLPRRFGKFVLRERLARGGMSDVFLAMLPGAEGFEKELVVKLIRSELAEGTGFVRRFVEEAKTCVRLTHPNIVSIFELGVEVGVLYMAMERVRGATLSDLLLTSGALDPDEGAYVILEVARALAHAHRRDVVHRDVTPGNVMIDEEGAVKLLDFGIAAPVGGIDDEIFGTPGHMPPEQLAGARPTPAADLFALATVAIEAWTGRPPFRRADPSSSRTALLGPSPPPLSASVAELGPLDDLIASCLQRDPTMRPQHADDVVRVLRRFLASRIDERGDGGSVDDLTRSLARRVRVAEQAKQARARGEVLAAPAIPHTRRPTPLGVTTQTFASRGAIATWQGPRTRRLDEQPSADGTLPEPLAAPAIPRLEGVATLKIASSTPPPAPRRQARSIAIVAVTASAVLLATIAGRVIHGRTSATSQPVAVSSTSAAPPAPSIAASVPVAATSPIAQFSTAAVPSSVGPVASKMVDSAIALSQLTVTASPPARIDVDGRPVGSSPVRISVGAGPHHVRFHPVGFTETFDRSFVAPAGGHAHVHGDFNDEPTIRVQIGSDG